MKLRPRTYATITAIIATFMMIVFFNTPVVAQELTIKQNKLDAKKLVKKPKKLKLKITGDAGFDPYGAVDEGPFEFVKAKMNPKKGKLKLTLLVPLGFSAGTYEIWVGDYKGNVTISGTNVIEDLQDSDQDGYDDDQDNCPETPNPGQQDADDDGMGDACDECPNDPDNDIDNDNICGDEDNCPLIANSGQEDADGDGIGDVCDSPQDSDQDGYDDDQDNCPETPNPGQQDADDDGMGDACDEDTIYGYISGEFQEGFEVNIAIEAGSVPTIIAKTITDADGYYAIGDLEDNWYEISPEYYDYIFFPESASVQISTGL